MQTGLAAVVGVVIARKLGRTAETDGFFAAYGVFIVLALAATAVRATVLPSLARAREAGRLSSETASYALAVGIVAAPLLAATVIAARPIAELLTGFGPDAAVDAAAAALPWMVVAGLGQFTAGLLASTLAALDDYVAALGRQFPACDQMRHQPEARILVQRLVEYRLEQRLSIGREALVGVPSWHIARPGDRYCVIGCARGSLVSQAWPRSCRAGRGELLRAS